MTVNKLEMNPIRPDVTFFLGRKETPETFPITSTNSSQDTPFFTFSESKCNDIQLYTTSNVFKMLWKKFPSKRLGKISKLRTTLKGITDLRKRPLFIVVCKFLFTTLLVLSCFLQ